MHRVAPSGLFLSHKAELGKLKTNAGLLGAAPRPLFPCSPALAGAGMGSRLQFRGVGEWVSSLANAAGPLTVLGHLGKVTLSPDG